MTESSQTNEFLRLLMANQKRIYAFILATVPNHQDADDLFQETVLLMWSKFDDFPAGHQLRGLGHHRRQIPDPQRAQAALGAEPALQCDGDGVASQRVRRVSRTDRRPDAGPAACIRKLSPRDYELIRLRYQDELSPRSLAQQMGRSVQSIYKRMARIHEALLRCVRRALGSEEFA